MFATPLSVHVNFRVVSRIEQQIRCNHHFLIARERLFKLTLRHDFYLVVVAHVPDLLVQLVQQRLCERRVVAVAAAVCRARDIFVSLRAFFVQGLLLLIICVRVVIILNDCREVFYVYAAAA